MRRTTSPVYARSKIWLDLNGRVALSEWRIQLLEAVGEAGSLAAAAGRLGVPYRTAWYKLREIEDRLGMRLLEGHSGGSDGGHTTLTPEAHDIIRRFHRVSNGVAELVQDRFQAEFPEFTC